jgi:biotin operon repressor
MVAWSGNPEISKVCGFPRRFLFVEIHSLDNERGCFASNRHFAEFLSISDRQVRTHIASLREKGFITVSIQDRYDRVIRAAGRYARVPDEKIKRLEQERTALIHRMSLRTPRG